MKVLIEIGHPAHVHFFSRTIERLKARGHGVWIVTRNKEITDALLERLAIPFVSLSQPARTGGGMALELLARWWKVWRLIRREKIDVAASISGISTSLPARFAGIRNVVFTDTEDARLSNRIAFPFADRILTPTFFEGNLGPKHERYEGLHELAYLRDFDFARAKAERTRLGLPERYSLIRIVKLDALHDRDVQGFAEADLEKLVGLLAREGEVFITSSAPLGPKFERYLLKTPIESVHAVMAGCRVFVGESPTMAVESSLLGRPAFLISGRVARLGNMVRLAEAGLLKNYSSWGEFLPIAERELAAALASEWDARAAKYRRESLDVSGLVESSLLGGSAGGNS